MTRWHRRTMFCIVAVAAVSLLSAHPASGQDAVDSQLAHEQLDVQYLTTQLIQDAIERLHAGRAERSINTAGTETSLTLPGPSGQQTVVTLDHASKQIRLRGPADSVQAWKQLITMIDRPPASRDEFTQLVPLTHTDTEDIKKAIQLIQLRGTTANGAARNRGAAGNNNPAVAQLAQAGGQQPPDAPPQAPSAQQPSRVAPGGVATFEEEGLQGQVQVEYLPGLDVIVLRGTPRDVERVMQIINEIEQLSVTEPTIEVLDLRHVNSEVMADLIIPLYDEVFLTRQGTVSITPLVKPNSILLIGRAENVRVVSELIQRLDQPVAPGMQFHVFRLRHMSAVDAEQTLADFYAERGGLGTRVLVIADYRTNSLIVQAGPRDAQEIAELLAEVDVASGAAVNELRVFKLRNTLAEELAPVLEGILRGQPTGGVGGQGGPGGFGGGAAFGANQTSPISTTLTLDTPGPTPQRLQAGLMTNVQVSADARSNSLIVRAPAESMPLIETLIRQLDDMPDETVEIKVFPIVNGDALLLVQVLQELFGNQQQVGAQQFGAQQLGIGLAENPLVPVRFSVDERTNSIIAVGSLADMVVIESILLRLDERDIRQRQSVVYRLRYAPAIDVSNAINQFLQSQRQLQTIAPTQVSPFQQIEREVIVVPEPVSNSLIVSATPRYFQDIQEIVEQLDARPPMVMIQVLIAEVSLDGFVELGIELGLQEPLLFDRSVLNDVVVPGFNFNNSPLGNSSSPASLATRSNVLSQGLTNFSLGRTNGQQGYGGFVFSASSDSVSVLIRALEDKRRLQVLSRPQIMTMDNQGAWIQVGARVPRITSAQLTQFGTINSTTLENVGVLLGVTPRISNDNIVVMELDAEKSELGPIDAGIPVSITADGDVIRSPVINTTLASTVVSARNGQTVVLGGLISETDSSIRRGVPVLSDIPILGQLFRYDQQLNERNELLIIMTPYIIRGDQDVSFINQMETERMSWCLADVYRVHGAFDALPFESPLGETAVPEVYPDQDPSAVQFMQDQSSRNGQPAVSPRRGAEVQAVAADEVVPVLPPKNVTGVAARQITWQTNTPGAPIERAESARTEAMRAAAEQTRGESKPVSRIPVEATNIPPVRRVPLPNR